MVERKRQRLLRQIISGVRDKKFDYETKEPKKRDWFKYDRAQCREIVEMLELIKLLVDAAERRLEPDSEPFSRGRPVIARPVDVAKVMLMQSYFQVANRPAEGLIILFSDRLELSTEFSYKTLERGYDDERVKRILDEVFRLTNEPVKMLETLSSVDGSGYPTSHKTNYSNDREKQRSKKSESDKFALSKKHDYVYNSAVIGTTYEIYSAWVPSTDHSVGELSLFPETFEMCQQNAPETKIFLGDGLYAVRDIVQAVATAEMIPITLPRRDTAFKKKGCMAWIKLLEKIVDNPQAFLRIYHNRSISETGFSTDKRKNTRPILKRLGKRKETESFLRGTNHNIKQLNYLKHTINLEIISPILNAT